MTHGDQLLPEHRDSARLFIAETLGIDAGDSVFDIASFTGREQVSRFSCLFPSPSQSAALA